LPDLAIQADAKLALQHLHAALAETGYRANAERVAVIQERRSHAIEAAADDTREETMPLKGRRIVHEINRIFGDNTILVKENGGADLWSYYWPYYQSYDAGCVIPPAEQTAMGYGVVGAIAAKMACPDRQVVCTTGDSAFQMAMHEIATAVQENAPVTWVVMNDSALGWVRWGQTTSLGERYIATEYDPTFDFVAVAKAGGCDGERITDPTEFGAALERALDANSRGVPYVIDVPVDQNDKHEEFIAFHNLR
jgi:acetolactate synthase I/II/III large subunit